MRPQSLYRFILLAMFVFLPVLEDVNAQLSIPTEVPVNRPKSKTTVELPQAPQTIGKETNAAVEFQDTSVKGSTTITNGLYLECPSSASVGERIFIRIKAKNPFIVSHIGTIAVSIEGGDPFVPPGHDDYDVLMPNGKFKMARFYKEGKVWLRRDIVFPTITHVEKYDDAWDGNTEKILLFPVTFQQAETASLCLRASFSVFRNNKTIVEKNIPDTSDHLDEQGFPCIHHTIRVTG